MPRMNGNCKHVCKFLALRQKKCVKNLHNLILVCTFHNQILFKFLIFYAQILFILVAVPFFQSKLHSHIHILMRAIIENQNCDFLFFFFTQPRSDDKKILSTTYSSLYSSQSSEATIIITTMMMMMMIRYAIEIKSGW